MPKVVLAGVATLALLAAAPAQADGLFSYVRLGQAFVFDANPRPAPGIGFGVRAALDSVAIDASFLNLVVGSHPVDLDRDMTAGSLLKLEVLRYLTPEMSRSVYVGGGMSWGLLSAGRTDPPGGGTTGWHGRGLQAELTADTSSRGPVRSACSCRPMPARRSSSRGPRRSTIRGRLVSSRRAPTVATFRRSSCRWG
jgi:hypothetical protein